MIARLILHAAVGISSIWTMREQHHQIRINRMGIQSNLQFLLDMFMNQLIPSSS